MKPLNILGFGGHGRVVADVALQMGFDSLQFFDDAYPELAVKAQYRLIGKSTDMTIAQGPAFVAIGNNSTRLRIFSALVQQGFELPALIHPSAIIGNDVLIGAGTVVMPGAVINNGARIGQACIINTHATIEHDCELEDGVHVSPNAALAGAVSLGQCAWIGIGASVKQGILVGQSAIAGAGAVLIRDVESFDTVAGVPARSIK